MASCQGPAAYRLVSEDGKNDKLGIARACRLLKEFFLSFSIFSRLVTLSCCYLRELQRRKSLSLPQNKTETQTACWFYQPAPCISSPILNIGRGQVGQEPFNCDSPQKESANENGRAGGIQSSHTICIQHTNADGRSGHPCS